ncbi:MAG: Tyrosine recombinase XerD [Candidatus Anoxychlamydiales bacterium]|nr:Tyrosine recombinase XerD [Candidatus Anoxychlamydiales bacterium]
MASIRKHQTKDGKIKFHVQIRLKGHAPQTASFDRLTDARKWIQEVESSIRNNRYFKTAESRKHDFNQLADRYIASVLPEKKTASDQKAQLFWWKKHIGNMLLADITPSIISEYKEKLLTEKTKKGKKRTGSTANRYLSIISHVFTVACKEWGWVRENPLSFVSKLKEPKGRVRFLSDDERERLLTTCKSSKNSYLYTIVVLALSSGMRLGEILNLTWSNVDFKHQRIILEETKNGERRQVPLKGRALDLLKLLQEKHSLCTKLLFPSKAFFNKPTDIRSAWEYALKKAKIENFKFHDLRHSCASYLAMNGCTIVEIAGVLGHKTLQMVKRYSHLSDSHLSEVVSRMNEKILG